MLKHIEQENIKELEKLLVPNRIQILHLLYKKDTCVCQMVKKLELKHNLISHHLKTLQEMGYISSKKNGQHVIYHLEESKKNITKNLFKLLNI
ncbi:MAG TPA: metalloregulator ArsR/SmtB family transcription factor [Candidatus Dojkabacteria bacterium]|nr:metalloregulator ArsR/SmtB family transcription factor [Candidatus Dojkabacteria bacterium]